MGCSVEGEERAHCPRGPALASQSMISIPVQRLDSSSDLPLPSYARLNDAGADLIAAEPAELTPGGGRALISTGIAIAIPAGYAGFVQPRSGLAAKHGVTVLNSPGLIDAGYRGELKVALVNLDADTPFKIERGDRIAQLVIQAVEHSQFTLVDELPADDDPNARGAGGFGHSGVQSS
jgi:dUTP pyrophosphatase